VDKEIIVIGGGPAGIEAAREAVRLGLSVTMVSAGAVGGRTGWHSLLPSKVWLAAAQKAQEVAAVSNAGAVPWGPQEILAHLARVKGEWNDQAREELESLGVPILRGTASFHSPGSIQVTDDGGNISASFAKMPVIVAAGSVPIFPPGLKPDGKLVIAPRLLSKLAKLPSSIVVIGAGATGCESAYLFNALGVAVTWIVDQFGILPQFQQEAGAALGQALKRQGVQIAAGQMVDTLERDEDKVTAVLMNGERYEADMVFVAVGRRADLDPLNLAAAGLESESSGRIEVDEYGRTANPLVYLTGDADGGVMTANKAQVQGRIAARHIAGVPVEAFDPSTLIMPVYTEPQVAQIGDLRRGTGIVTKRISFKKSLKAHIMMERNGFLELFYNEQDGRILGAVAVGPHAADVLSPLAIAIQFKGHIDQLAAVYAAYPSLSELPFVAAREANFTT
jgi:dihydrolipoamide dehydrogenase